MKSLLFFFVVLSLTGCGNNQNQQHIANLMDTTLVTPPFPYTQPPSMLIDPSMQYEYMAIHFWDNFDFSNTKYIPVPDITEKAWTNYISILFRVQPSLAQKSIKNMYIKAAESGNKKLFQYFTDLAEKHLYEPNSPARNEELYISVLEVMTGTPLLNDTEKVRPQTLLTMAYQNRLGTKALDFQYTDISGKVWSMYQSRTDYILLFFNNPECSTCREHVEAMRNEPIFNRLIRERKLQILSIYTDQDVEMWKNNVSLYPDYWIVGYDQTFSIGTKYDLKASPTLYLLDGNKIVLLKDATLPAIENFIANN
ncbi:MAG: DUF5106 domain-containing protein [Tannerella sp.]|nr:DUF5106 domain-containing protein [Tannerella sp.]